MLLIACSEEVDPSADYTVERFCGAETDCATTNQGGQSMGGFAGFSGSNQGGVNNNPAGFAGSSGNPETSGAGGTAGYMMGGVAGAVGEAGTTGQGGMSGNENTAGTGGNTTAGIGGNTTAGIGENTTAGTGGIAGEGGEGGTGGDDNPCPPEMVNIENFCMDRYEAPNEPGAMPLAMQIAQDGEAWCEVRGKRLCTEAEWLRACEGSTKTKYPYGNTYKEHRCNDDKTWISPDWNALATWPSPQAQAEASSLYQADPSGSRADCISEDGILDLTGNVAEWVVRSFPTQKNYDHVLKGCYWSKCYGGSNPSCTFVNGAHPGNFRTYEAGFRCCSNPLP